MKMFWQCLLKTASPHSSQFYPSLADFSDFLPKGHVQTLKNEDFRFDDCVYSIVTQFKKQIVSLILFVEIIIAIVMSHRYLII